MALRRRRTMPSDLHSFRASTPAARKQPRASGRAPGTILHATQECGARMGRYFLPYTFSGSTSCLAMTCQSFWLVNWRKKQER